MGSVSAASGDKIYVNGSSGNDAWNGLTPNTAKASIKNATKTVNTGGTVYVFEGTYSGSNNSNIVIDHDMTIQGTGKTKTIIDGLDSNRIFTVLSGVTFNLKNLTITNGKSANGGGLFNNGTTNIDGCKFTDCKTTYTLYGGGAAINNGEEGTLYVQNSDFINNNAEASTAAGGGGAIMAQGTTSLQNCNFIGNSAYAGGAILTIYEANVEINRCSFINNTSNSAGGAMEIYSNKNVVNIHYSSFTGNSATFISTNNIDNGYKSSLNVNSNWWGTNSGPIGIVGQYIATNWIYMTLNVNPDTIKIGKTSNVTANFNHLYDGTTVTDIDPTQDHIPDGTIVNFTTSLGNIDPNTAGTVNGLATASYKSTNVGIASVTATSDSQQLSQTITVAPLSTTVKVNDVSNFPGQKVTITAKVYDENGDPVDGGVVSFTVFGKTNKVSVKDGIATLTFKIPFSTSTGTYNILTQYDGTGTIYSNSETSGNLLVTKMPTVLTVDDVKGSTGDTITIHAVLKDYYGDPVSGGKVDFNIDGTKLSGTTNENGAVTVTYQITETTGSYPITALFNGTSELEGSNGKGTLTVNPINTHLTVQDVTGKNSNKTNLKATLTDKNNNPLSNQTITFSINKKTIGTAVTDSTGTATLSYLLNKSGNFSIHAYYNENSIYSSTSNSGNLTVTPWAELYLTSTNNNKDLKTGETFKITYKLGNKGPDTANNVIITFKIPEGLQLVNVAVDNGKWTFDPLTRTLTWTLNSVVVGDPNLELTLKALKAGNYTITPTITANTTINTTNNGNTTIIIQKISNNTNNTNGTNNTNLPKTGLPISPLILGIIMVLGGIATRKI